MRCLNLPAIDTAFLKVLDSRIVGKPHETHFERALCRHCDARRSLTLAAWASAACQHFRTTRNITFLPRAAFSSLRKKKLVDSVQGPGGDYLLGREANDIAIGEVISAVDESIDATRCHGQADCQGGDRCLTHSLWQDLSDRISTFLNSITLGELMAKRGVQEVAGRQDSAVTLRNITNDIEVSIQL